ncbi:MAG: DUF1080 domain-containing protein [Chloroflexi bacterium]|nr:DUF1080 domain-containing protein [Chloroflexota bacterium]
MEKKMSNRGQGLVEYLILISLVTAVIFLSLEMTGTSIQDLLCQAADSIGDPPSSCTTSVFEDDFDNLDQWTVISGDWKIRDGRLCGGPGEGRIFAPIPDLDDYEVTLSGAKLDTGNGYGLYFRASNFKAVNGYTFQYDPGASGYLFRRWYQGNEFYPQASVRLSNYNYYDSSHEIKVRAQGDTYTAFVDGQQVYQVKNANYLSGGIGLRTWTTTRACFDSIRVDRIP